MIERELVGQPFLRPRDEELPEEGYLDCRSYCAQLAKQGVIGCYSRSGVFHLSKSLTHYHKEVIPLLANALAQDPRSSEYKKYKMASLEKGTLLVRLEWGVAQYIQQEFFHFTHAAQLKKVMGCEVLLVDRHGPAYDVLVPSTVASLMASQYVELDGIAVSF